MARFAVTAKLFRELLIVAIGTFKLVVEFAQFPARNIIMIERSDFSVGMALRAIVDIVARTARFMMLFE